MSEARATLVPGSQHRPSPLPFPRLREHVLPELCPQLNSPAAGEKTNSKANHKSKAHNFQQSLTICRSEETTLSVFPTTWGTKFCNSVTVINQGKKNTHAMYRSSAFHICKTCAQRKGNVSLILLELFQKKIQYTLKKLT